MTSLKPAPSLAERPGRAGSPTIILSANSSWNLANFRAGLIGRLQAEGYRVVAAAPDDGHSSRLRNMGVDLIATPMNSAGASVIEDARLLLRYVRIFRAVRPFAFLGFTAKPNIYGSLAAQLFGTKVINNISGLGTVFIRPGRLTSIVSRLYRLALRKSSTIFFQNSDDMAMFVARGLVRKDRAELLPGSGVDLARFTPRGTPRAPGPFRFLLVGRLLWDKGIGEYVEAARILLSETPELCFQILGAAGVNNRTAVPLALLERWQAEGVVDYLGEAEDVRPALEQADCILLPSYREGLPRSLLEGSAMGKPLIATDVPGCRDVVADGETGFLCEARSADSLAKVMRKMVQASPDERRRMGERGRARIERDYCETRVVDKYLSALARS